MPKRQVNAVRSFARTLRERGEARRIGRVGVVVGIALLLAVSAPSRAGSSDPRPGVVVYSSQRDGHENLYAVNADGTHLSALTHTTHGACCAVASPDGTISAFTRTQFLSDSLREDLWLVPSSGARPRIIRGGGDLFGLTWSPDGRRLAGRTPTTLYVIDPRHPRLHRVARAGRIDDVSWSPDGRTLAFVARSSDETMSASVFVTDVDGGNSRRLDVAAGGVGRLTWSPDGRRLAAFEGTSGLGYDLVLLDPSGTSRRVVATGVDPSGSAWSPDGRRLALVPWEQAEVDVVDPESPASAVVVTGTFVSWSPDAHRLLLGEADGMTVVDVDRGSTVRLSGDAAGPAAWSPDGSRLAVAIDRGRNGALGIADAHGMVARINVAGYVEGIHWAPDGASVVFAAYTEHFDPQVESTANIFVARADGSHVRMLTRRGDNTFVAWRPGTVPPAIPRVHALPRSEEVTRRGLRTRAPIFALAADGTRVAAAIAATTGDCKHITVWNPARKTVGRLETPSGGCTESFANPLLLDFALAGERAAWAMELGCGNVECDYLVGTATLANPGVEVILGLELDKDGPLPRRFSVHGHGDLLVFQYRGALNRVATGTTTGCDPQCAALDTAEPGNVVDVAGGLIALVAPRTGHLAVIDEHGTTVGRLQFAPHNLPAIRLDGSRLVAVTRSAVRTYDIRTGALETSLPRPPRALALVDVANGLVLFTGRRTIEVLRISDRTTWTFTVPGVGALARLEPSGLFYSYVVKGRWPGRAEFVPFKTLLAHLG